MLNKEKLENLANEIWKGAIKLRGKFKATKRIEETDKSGNGKSSISVQKSWSRKRTRTN